MLIRVVDKEIWFSFWYGFYLCKVRGILNFSNNFPPEEGAPYPVRATALLKPAINYTVPIKFFVL